MVNTLNLIILENCSFSIFCMAWQKIFLEHHLVLDINLLIYKIYLLNCLLDSNQLQTLLKRQPNISVAKSKQTVSDNHLRSMLNQTMMIILILIFFLHCCINCINWKQSGTILINLDLLVEQLPYSHQMVDSFQLYLN